MRIFIDADSCPVTDETVTLAREHNLECIIVSDQSHEINKDGATSITVSVGDNSADYAIVSMIKRGDILITADTGLAGICEAKGAVILNHIAEVYDFDRVYDSMWILSRRQSRERKIKLAKVSRRKLMFSEGFSKLIAEKRLAEQEELSRAKRISYQEKLRRRKERILQKNAQRKNSTKNLRI